MPTKPRTTPNRRATELVQAVVKPRRARTNRSDASHARRPTIHPGRADLLDRMVDHDRRSVDRAAPAGDRVGTLTRLAQDLTDNIQRTAQIKLREVEITGRRADSRRDATSWRRESALSIRRIRTGFAAAGAAADAGRVGQRDVFWAMVPEHECSRDCQLPTNDLSAQSRLTRELQQQLMRVRHVCRFRTCRAPVQVARQTAKESARGLTCEIVARQTYRDRTGACSSG